MIPRATKGAAPARASSAPTPWEMALARSSPGLCIRCIALLAIVSSFCDFKNRNI
jgi:hypothetical protein